MILPIPTSELNLDQVIQRKLMVKVKPITIDVALIFCLKKTSRRTIHDSFCHKT